MSSSKTYSIAGITPGMYMSWFVTTQATNRITVKLFDDTKVYFESGKQSIDIDPPLALGADYVAGNNLKMTVTSSGNNEIKSWHNTSDISTADGGQAGRVFVFAGEDYIDSDYNDVYVSISAWKKAH